MNKNINIGLIGYGYWGPNVARNIHNNPSLNLSVICDKNLERLTKARSVFIEQTNYSPSSEELFNDESLDAVAIATETSSHYILVKKALEAGKHVYVEKPFTDNVNQAQELLELAISKGLVIHIDHIMIYHPVIRKLKELIDHDELGEILYIDAMRMNLGQIKKDVSAMWDLAVHDLSIIDYLTGGETPIQVNAMGEKYYNPKESLSILTLRYSSFLATVQSSWIFPLKERKLIIVGDKKMAVYDDVKVSEKVMIYNKGVDVLKGNSLEYDEYVVKTREGDVWSPYIPQEDALYNSLDHFRECIKLNKDSFSGATQAIRVQSILERADRNMS
jgi:predicted dehydrogenase